MGQGLGERGGGFKKCAGFFLFVGVLYYYVSTTISTMYRSTRPVYLNLEGAAGVWCRLLTACSLLDLGCRRCKRECAVLQWLLVAFNAPTGCAVKHKPPSWYAVVNCSQL